MTITLIQWNVLYTQDITQVAGFLAKQQPDVVCLQELAIGAPYQPEPDGPAYVAATLGYNYHYKSIPYPDTDVKLANAVFSRFPITAKRELWINQPAEYADYDAEYRAYVEATLDCGGKPLTVGTVHMTYTDRFVETTAKNQEADRLLAAINGNSKLFVITGDLNALPGSYTVKQLESVYQNAGPSYDQNTWTTKPFAYNGFEETELRWRLDHIFASHDVRTVKSEVLQTEFSDHLPLKTLLEL